MRLGRNFNRLYFESWKKEIAEKKSFKEYSGTSVKNVVIFSLLSSLILSLPVVAIVKTEVFQALYSANSYGSVEDVEEKEDENKVIYGYNSFNPGVDIDEYASAEIKGGYITDMGTGFSLDENMCLNIFEEGNWKCQINMSVNEFQNGSLVIAGYIEEQYWEEMYISSENEAYYKLKFVVQNGQVISIFTGDKEVSFRKVSSDDFAEEMWRALDAEYRGKQITSSICGGKIYFISGIRQSVYHSKEVQI
ncbi:MAG: hypothetical protein VB018_09255 [Lachnospiraceae bacterium]|nr:hypothetical protein [Lachnospiraceae bacterium]